MYAASHVLLSAPSHHTGLFYAVIAVTGLIVVIAIVVSLLVLVLRNIGGQWPIR